MKHIYILSFINEKQALRKIQQRCLVFRLSCSPSLLLEVFLLFPFPFFLMVTDFEQYSKLIKTNVHL